MAPRRRILPARLEALGEGGEGEGPAPVGRGPGVDPQAGRGDHPEGALAAHEQLGEVGAGGRPGGVALGAHHGPVGQDDLEADHHVLDLPVAGGVLARAPAGQPAADRGQVHRLGEVAEGVAVADRPEGRLEVRTEQPRRDVGHQRRLVDDDRPHQAGAVEGDPAEDRHRPPAHPAAAGHGGDRHAGRRAGGQGGGHLGGVGRAHHRRRPGRDLAPGGPADGQRPPVAPGRHQVGVAGAHLGAAGRDLAHEPAVDGGPGSRPAGRRPPPGRRRPGSVGWGWSRCRPGRRTRSGRRPPPARPGPGRRSAPPVRPSPQASSRARAPAARPPAPPPAALGRAAWSRARVRRDSTSSTEVAISQRAA